MTTKEVSVEWVQGTGNCFGCYYSENRQCQHPKFVQSSRALPCYLNSLVARPIEEKPEMVKDPKHYDSFENVSTKELIAACLDVYVKKNPSATPYQIWCAGTELKYRFRMGAKDDIKQELGKIKEYSKMRIEGVVNV